MNDPWGACGPAAARLDPRSRHTLVQFLSRGAVLTALFAWPYVAGRWTLHESVGLLVIAYQTGCFINLFLALSRRDAVAGPHLNHWDAALAYTAMSHLASFVWGRVAAP